MEHNQNMQNMPSTSPDDVIDLLELARVLLRRIWIILAAGFVGACALCAYTIMTTVPLYQSTVTTLLVVKETTMTSLADLQFSAQLSQDYTELIYSRPVLQEAIDNLGIDMNYMDLRANLKVVNPEDTHMLRLTVTSTDPLLAKELVDEIADVSSVYIGDKMEIIPPKIIEYGEIPQTSTGSPVKKNTVMGMLAGMVLAAGIFVVLYLMNDTVRTEEDIEKYLGIPVLASVPDRKDYVGGKKPHARKSKKKKKGE